ncbi:hypothetical protein V9L13_05205 [Pseudomonas sp. RSB 5.4]|jgi:hypothetical protein|uniref:hypothetical protein n=1 Tax=Pseudomonas sp. RSB 5.4 TaxID=3127459 RepID=UPI0030D2B0B3
MDTISSIYKAAANAHADSQSVTGHLDKLKSLLGNSDFYRELEKSLGYNDKISRNIAASGTPMARALEVNQMSESERLELTMQVDLGL